MSNAVKYDSYKLTVTSHCLHGNIETYYVNIEWDKYTAQAEISISPDGSKYHVLDVHFDDQRIPLYVMYYFCKGLIALGEGVLIEAVKDYCSQLYPTA